MSVAFRRESDEEHLEPRFELPIPPGPNLVTPRGYALIAARANDLEGLLATDLAEDERKATLREARYWRSRLASAQLAPTPDGSSVTIGTTVTITGDGSARTVYIVGHDESDPAAGRIAFNAPVARALLGCEVGDEADLPGTGGTVVVTSIKVAD